MRRRRVSRHGVRGETSWGVEWAFPTGWVLRFPLSGVVEVCTFVHRAGGLREHFREVHQSGEGSL